MSRFDYVQYDQIAQDAQAELKGAMTSLEALVKRNVHSPRDQALVMTKLEEAYMWMGKGIRNDQLTRNDGVAKLQEERVHS